MDRVTSRRVFDGGTILGDDPNALEKVEVVG